MKRLPTNILLLCALSFGACTTTEMPVETADKSDEVLPVATEFDFGTDAEGLYGYGWDTSRGYPTLVVSTHLSVTDDNESGAVDAGDTLTLEFREYSFEEQIDDSTVLKAADVYHFTLSEEGPMPVDELAGALSPNGYANLNAILQHAGEEVMELQDSMEGGAIAFTSCQATALEFFIGVVCVVSAGIPGVNLASVGACVAGAFVAGSGTGLYCLLFEDGK